MKKFLVNFVIFVFIVIFTTMVGVSITHADGKKSKKVQEVSFDGSAVDGDLRRPDGSYLVQKRGVDFAPLYNVKSQFDQSIKESVDHLR